MEPFDELVEMLEAFLSYIPVQDLRFAFHYYGGCKANATCMYMKRTKCLRKINGIVVYSHNYFYDYGVP